MKRCEYVVMEASFKAMYQGEIPFTEILKMMEGRNFEFLRPVGWLTEPYTGEVLQLDALFRRSIFRERLARPSDTQTMATD